MYEASILLALLHELVGSVSLSNDTTRSNVLLNTVSSLAVPEKQFTNCRIAQWDRNMNKCSYFATLVGRKYTSLQLCSCRLVLKVHNNDTYDASIQLDSIHKLIGLVSLCNETACSASWNILLNAACSLRVTIICNADSGHTASIALREF